ncbi:hypothetical protein BJ742DRAFT_839767 [Cladochytrium replicatum]|nr:hypothetical protein BJ742DRAFT_839767 [Cladochytrium replicatum]
MVAVLANFLNHLSMFSLLRIFVHQAPLTSAFTHLVAPLFCWNLKICSHPTLYFGLSVWHKISSLIALSEISRPCMPLTIRRSICFVTATQ